MTKSTHKVEVVPVVLEKHDNADSLSIVRPWGYSVCVKTADWQDLNHKYGLWGTLRYLARFKKLPPKGPLGAYVPPDSICPDTEQFKFLDGHMRIKVKKLRGVVSMGLLLPAPVGSIPGDDVADHFGIIHYEPNVKLPPGVKIRTDAVKGPDGYHPVYDVDSLRRYASAFVPGEDVWVTEKIHGMNARYCWDGEKMHAGSHNHWRKYDPESIYWRVLEKHPELEAWLQRFPGYTVYGEIYGGGVQKGFDYGRKSGDFGFAVFDILSPKGEWVSADVGRLHAAELPWVPLIGEFKFDFDTIAKLAEGPSTVPGAKHVREGVVVKPLRERTHPKVGRVNLKLVGNGYYLAGEK